MKLANQGTGREACSRSDDQGYALAVILVAMAILGLWTAALLPTWLQQSIREKEYELAFRGEQYARAIGLYQKLYRAFPPDVDALVNAHTLRKRWKDPITGEDFLYITGSSQPGVGGTSGAGTTPGGASGSSFSNAGRGATTPPAQAPGAAGAGRQGVGTPPASGAGQPSQGGQGVGFQGVQSKSTATSIRIYNGKTHYNEWQFVAMLPSPPTGGQGTGVGSGSGPGRGGPGTQGGPQGPAGPGGGRGGPQGPAGGGRGGLGTGAPPITPTGTGRGRGGT